jgi:hypothetical protein
MKVDKLSSRKEVVERFKNLDATFEVVKRSGKLLTRYQLGLTSCPTIEKGGIYVHFMNGAVPIFGGGGFHRLAMARALNLETIPVCIGLVSFDSVPIVNSLIDRSN